MVSDDSLQGIVLSTIDLDYKTTFETGEVGDMAGDRNLPAKMPAFLFQQAQFVPKLLLGIRGIAAQVTGELIGH